MAVVRVTIVIEEGARIDNLSVKDRMVPVTYSTFFFDAPDDLNDKEIIEFARVMAKNLYEESGMLIHGLVFVEGREKPIGRI